MDKDDQREEFKRNCAARRHCCGTYHTTNYCPHCGAKLHQVTLEGLKEHCRAQTEAARNRLESYKARVFSPDADEKKIQSHTAHLEKLFHKWSTWHDLLEELL